MGERGGKIVRHHLHFDVCILEIDLQWFTEEHSLRWSQSRNLTLHLYFLCSSLLSFFLILQVIKMHGIRIMWTKFPLQYIDTIYFYCL